MLEDDPVGRLKVYVYELPPKYNKNILAKDSRCLKHMFATEIFIHRFLLSSAVRTLNPEEADWFYTPVYTTCDLTPWGHPLTTKSPRMMRSAIQYISKRWPYWNRTEGADHFFVTPHDFGACFYFQVSHRAMNHEPSYIYIVYQRNLVCKLITWNSSLVISQYSICYPLLIFASSIIHLASFRIPIVQEAKAIERGVLPVLRRATLVQTFGQKHHVCLKEGSITIPPYTPPHKMRTHLIPPETPRSIFVYFRGLFYDTSNDPEGGYYARYAPKIELCY